MEGGGADAGATRWEAGNNPVAQLPGRPARKGEDEDLGGFGLARFDEMGGPTHQEFGLTGAWPGHDQLWSVAISNRFWPPVGFDPDVNEVC